MGLRYVLGIDLGISSIGTALFKIKPEATDLNDIDSFESILDAGVRICSCPEGAEARRIARNQRTHKKHKKLRKAQLTKLLQEYGLLPLNKSDIELGLRSSPYALRAKAMQEPLQNPFELGFCIMNIAKLRGAGFIDENEEDETSSSVTNRYTLLENILKQEKLTLSEFLAKHLKENECVRQRKEFLETKVKFSVPRYLVKKDFHALMQNQAKNFSITEEQIKAIYHIIFMDFPKAPYANAPCSLLPDSGNRLPKMHRLAEYARIYQQCNNIRYKTQQGTKALTKEMRDALVAILMQGEGLTKKRIKDVLQKYTDEKILTTNNFVQDEEVKAIKPFALIKAFKDIPSFWQLSEEEQDLLIEFIADPINTEINTAKPVLYDEETFLARCMEKLNLTGIEGEQKMYACLNALPKDRTMLGKKATHAILEKLKEGIIKDTVWVAPTYYDAVKACEFKEIAVKQQNFENLPYYGEVLPHAILPIHPWHIKRTVKEERIGRVANPVVHSILNQLRKVVNEIISLYGKPEMIKLEVARDFGLSKIKRNKLIREQLQNEKNNLRIDKELEKYHYAITSTNRLKYKLWESQNKKDTYTQETIQVMNFMSYEIDHIIPQSAGGTNTLSNLVLTRVNNLKSDSFAYDFIQSNFSEHWEAIKKDLELMPKNKAWRFTAEAKENFCLHGDELDENYADRRLQDTRYMTKIALQYLQCICSNILAIRGSMTAQLRTAWQLSGIEFELMGLNVPRHQINKETGEVYYVDGEPEINSDWEAKPRIDHRHHALDAIVLCAITRSLAQKMYKASKRNQKLDIGLLSVPFIHSSAYPKEKDFRHIVIDTLKNIKISHKAEHDTNTKLHNETAMRVLDYDSKSNLYVAMYMRSLEKIDSFSKLEKIAVEENLGDSNKIQQSRIHCATIIKAVKAQKFAAEASLIQKNAEYKEQGKKEIKITEQSLVQEAIRLANVGKKYPVIERTGLVNIKEKQQCGYEPGSNHRVDFFVYTEGKKKGKIGWECIKSIDAANPHFKPQWQENAKLLWSVCKGDLLELRLNQDLIEKYHIPMAFLHKNEQNEDIMLAKVLEFSSTYMVVVSCFDARQGTANANKMDKKSFTLWTSGNNGLKTFCIMQARKVLLTPFGKIRKKEKKLWNGKKV